MFRAGSIIDIPATASYVEQSKYSISLIIPSLRFRSFIYMDAQRIRSEIIYKFVVWETQVLDRDAQSNFLKACVVSVCLRVCSRQNHWKTPCRNLFHASRCGTQLKPQRTLQEIEGKKETCWKEVCYS